MQERLIRYDPKEIAAIGDWLKLVVRDEPGMKLVLHYDGKEHEVSKGHILNVLHSAAKELEIARRIEDRFEIAGRLQTSKLRDDETTAAEIDDWMRKNEGMPWHLLSKDSPNKASDEKEWHVPDNALNYLMGCRTIIKRMEESWRFCKETLDKMRPKQKSYDYKRLQEDVELNGCSIATDDDFKQIWKCDNKKKKK